VVTRHTTRRQPHLMYLAAVRAIVRHANSDQAGVVGFRNGWQGLVENDFMPLDRHSVTGILPRGGTILGTSRFNPTKDPKHIERLKENWRTHELAGLIVVGGEGSLSATLELWRTHHLQVVGVPKTIDNDIRGTDFTFGFDTAVSIVTDAIDRLHSTAIHLLRRVRKQDAATGEGPARLSALSVLVFGGPMTLGQLAAAEQVKPPTMSRIVTGLEESRLAERLRDAKDARRVRIRATPNGERLLHQGRRRRIEYLASHLGGLTREELATLEQAVRLLEGVLRDWPSEK